MQKGGFVYLLTNKIETTLYTGVTANLKRRLWEHEHHVLINSFTSRYNIKYLVYYEWYDNIGLAIQREKTIKKWGRAKKVALINTANREWLFLNEAVYNDLYTLLY